MNAFFNERTRCTEITISGHVVGGEGWLDGNVPTEKFFDWMVACGDLICALRGGEKIYGLPEWRNDPTRFLEGDILLKQKDGE